MVARYLQEQPHSLGDCGSLLMGFLDFYGNFFDPRATGISVRRRQYFLRANNYRPGNFLRQGSLPFGLLQWHRRHNMSMWRPLLQSDHTTFCDEIVSVVIPEASTAEKVVIALHDFKMGRRLFTGTNLTKPFLRLKPKQETATKRTTLAMAGHLRSILCL